jgi:hypothetical protein
MTTFDPSVERKFITPRGQLKGLRGLSVEERRKVRSVYMKHHRLAGRIRLLEKLLISLKKELEDTFEEEL